MLSALAYFLLLRWVWNDAKEFYREVGIGGTVTSIMVVMVWAYMRGGYDQKCWDQYKDPVKNPYTLENFMTGDFTYCWPLIDPAPNLVWTMLSVALAAVALTL